MIGKLKNLIAGEVVEHNLELYAHDASIFEVEPKAAVKPRDVEDVKKLVKFVAENKPNNPGLSLTARAAGSDMSGGPLNEFIIVDFENFNKVLEVNNSSQSSFAPRSDLDSRSDLEHGVLDADGYAITEPGVYYRDFEKATLAKGLLLPSYPASREICTVGGMVANNAGGEKSLAYGKTADYVEELSVVLGDGEEYTLKAMGQAELDRKKSQNNFEGHIYREMHNLLEQNYDLIKIAKPKVSKNSAGYALWDVWDRDKFDLTRLFTGSQGTLGLITQIKFRLIRPKPISKLLVIFLPDLKQLADIVEAVMKHGPESFESYDDNILKLAIRFLPSLIKIMKGSFFGFAWKFLPELWLIATGGVPKLVLLAEFTGDDEESVERKAKSVKQEIDSKFKIKSRIATSQSDAKKYWTIRRESFNLLRKHVSGKKTAPFIDDIIVRPEKLVEFLPQLEQTLAPYKNLTYTMAGHAGDGNFHIIPLMDLKDPSSRQTIQELSEKVYNLVIGFGGSITAEHNDGLIRTPYLEKMYGPRVYDLFKKTKQIFDPQNIFNPGKKVFGDLQYALDHIKIAP